MEIAGKYCQTNKIVLSFSSRKILLRFLHAPNYSIIMIFLSLVVVWFVLNCKMFKIASSRCICVASFNFLAFVILFVYQVVLGFL